jgi:hypothetical protein
LGANGSLESLKYNRSSLNGDSIVMKSSMVSLKTPIDKALPRITIASINNGSNYSLNVPCEIPKSESPGDCRETSELATYKYYFSAAPWLGWLVFIAALSIGVTSKIFQCKASF